jgi:hypothetical protein
MEKDLECLRRNLWASAGAAAAALDTAGGRAGEQLSRTVTSSTLYIYLINDTQCTGNRSSKKSSPLDPGGVPCQE